MKKELINPVMRCDRVVILLQNAVTYISTDVLTSFTEEEKINILKDILGMSDAEIEALDIKNHI